jgi:hypothetical protein
MQRVKQGGFPGAGRPVDDHRGTPARMRPRQQANEVRELSVPLEQACGTSNTGHEADRSESAA